VANGLGVGWAISKTLVESFGPTKLPAIIKNEPHKLAQVVKRSFDWRGLSARWKSKTDEEHAAMIFYLSHRTIGFSDAARAIKHYGLARAVGVLQDDPFQLSFDISGIGFEKADKIAQEIGTGKGSDKRAQAALFHALNKATEEGDVFITRKNWINKAEFLMGHGFGQQLATMIGQLVERGYVYEVLLENRKTGKPSLVYYTKNLYLAEATLAKKLRALQRAVPLPLDPTQHLAAFEKENNVELSDKQKEIVHLVGRSPVVIVTGGPGTGKSTSMRAVTTIFEDDFGLPASLMAFAGAAAKRLREVTGKTALTIHKTLEYDPVHEQFNRGEDNPLDADLVVIDEVSMIDTQLLSRALSAVKLGARLLLVGDSDQLPSIGPGAALRDIIDSKIFPVVVLDHIFRQSRRSRIATSAARIRQGKLPVPAVRINADMEVLEHAPDPEAPDEDEPLRDYIDLEIRRPPQIPTPGNVEQEPFDLSKVAAATIVKLVRNIEKRYGIDPRTIQILCPMNVKTAGADELNRALQAALNPQPANSKSSVPPGKKKLQIGSPREDVSPGDKVMQLRNDYRKSLYNGDLGFVTFVDHREVVVDFRDDLPRATTRLANQVTSNSPMLPVCTRCKAKKLRASS
jgi:exodeoxyribonuclease V alpha subunit